MAEQFNEILDNLDEEEQQTSESTVEVKPVEHKTKKQKTNHSKCSKLGPGSCLIIFSATNPLSRQ